MTVKELIEELKKYPENMIIITQNEENYEPCCQERTLSFSTDYWSKFDLKSIPANEKHLIL